MKQFEEVIRTVGSFGRYQKFQCLLIFIVGGGTAFFQLGNTFYSASADHYCRVYNDQTFTDVSSVKNCTVPYTTDGDDIVWNKCKRYDVHVNTSQDVSVEVCFPRSDDTLKCDQGWVYDKTWYENTVVFEYDLVCDKDWMKQLSKSIVPVGNLVGSVVFGQISDIFGRKPVFIITLILTVAISIGTSFTQSYTIFIIGQFCLGVCPLSLFITSQVMVMELVGMEFRTMCGILSHVGISLFYMLMGVIALLCDGDWRKIQLIVGIIYVLYLPSIFLVTESPMWLMQKHKYDKCLKVLKRFARFNKTTIPDNFFEDEKKLHLESKSEERQHTLIDLLKPPRLRLRTLLMCFNWFSCSFVYYGISLNTDQLGENPYTTFILAGFVEIPGRLLAWWLMGVIGRRWSLCGFSIIGGLALILSVPPELPEVSTAIALVAKMCIAAVFTIVYVYGAEIFPTVVRNAGLGVSSMSARVGSIISPYVVLLDVYWAPLPFVIMGGTSAIAGLTALFLPETRNKKLPATIEDGETFGTKYDEKRDGEDTKVNEQPWIYMPLSGCRHPAGASDYDTSRDMNWNDKSLTLKSKGKMCIYDINPERHLTCSLGPCYYRDEYTDTGRHAPAISIAARHIDGVKDGHPNSLVQPVDTHGFKTPGPNYRPNSGYWGRGPKKSFGLSKPAKHETLGPGPAGYIVNGPDSKAAYTLAKRLPDTQGQGWRQASDPCTPGPNAYNIGTTMGKGVAMSVRSRQPVHQKIVGPSPNAYMLPDSIRRKPTALLTHKPFELKEETKPGPTVYQLNGKTLRTAPIFSCRKQCKPCFPDILNYPNEVKEISPAPGSYHRPKKFTQNDNPSFSMGKRAKNWKNEVPGPNHYDIATPHRPDAKKAPSFSITGKFRPIEKHDSPGPAAYFPPPISDQPRYSMSKRHTGGSFKSSNPAPNAYIIGNGQTAKGVYSGGHATLKGRASPYVHSGLAATVRLHQ
ncbi:organic cation transporter protein-like [Glandiceps talaboti]